MFQVLRSKLEAKRAVWSQETQQRIAEYAELEKQSALLEMERKESVQSLLNTEIGKYLRTEHPTFLLKPDVYRALLNMLHTRSEGTFNVSLTMTKDMRRAYAYYHNELKYFIDVIERKGFRLDGQEELFLNSFLTKLRENNYRYNLEQYGDFIPEHTSLIQAFDAYLEVMDTHEYLDSGKLDFFATYLNHKDIADFTWTKSKLKRKLKQYLKSHKHEFKMKKIERKLQDIS
ncbi:hypothetical protein [Salisediminibacterium selenitireducens]|uniref:Uncharacterized protein n=1 Tax=Bacillus selenitireducens (strain ATCC 700615 / DSM 15326 / MLS10) TaxID=439292 RepID=D6XSG3_BACIE|nr:hypothetical protein [Salisediminibacterium selenitireducens]ADH98749.1 hypothetical protein Bsel_1237 [[Bacillus] selenitireducens MLS10]